MLSRGGLEISGLWAVQHNLVEIDERLRGLERRALAGNDPSAYAEYRRALVRSGDTEALRRLDGAKMQRLVDEHHDAKRVYDRAPIPQSIGHESYPKGHVDRYIAAKRAIRDHHRETGINPADHAQRWEDETPNEFGSKLIDLSLANGTVYPPDDRNPRSTSHGTISFDHDEHDEHGHRRNRDAVARAWEREVPGGWADIGDRTYGDREARAIKGSYVHLRTGPRPNPRRR